MELKKYPDPILLKKAAAVPYASVSKTRKGEIYTFYDETLGFIHAFKDFYRAGFTWGKPLGLAAPQVGRSVRIFIAGGDVFINPEIVELSPHTADYKEGCYSLKENKFDYPVTRSLSVILEWTTESGTRRKAFFKGFQAQVILHEFDHLEGRLCSGAKGV